MKDPVCKMDVTNTPKGGTVHWQGETYAFCSETCRLQFIVAPKHYLNPERTPGMRDHCAK